jgi:uncharacterized Ntn-hydrolase superfamily protein
MTCSIVALDPETRELGVAVLTGWPAVGAIVPWVEPGVGAVATQSFTNIGLGPLGLAALRAGHAAPDALRTILADDPAPELRQLGIVDVQGRSAACTGARCVAEAGHVTAPGLSVQSNMMEREGIPEAVLRSVQAAKGELVDRLLTGLEAVEAAGGDIRGTRSAAVIVAPGTPDPEPWARRFDLRVDHAERPVAELARLVGVSRAYALLSTALDTVEAGDPDLALEDLRRARTLAPQEAQIVLWHAAVLFRIGEPAAARAELASAHELEPRLPEFARRVAEAGRWSSLTAALERAASDPGD